MSANEFSVRSASADDLDTATRLGVTLLPGFHVGPTDFSCVFAHLDPTAFYVGELNGEIISYIVAVKYPGHSAFLSTFAVAEEHRGKGYGRKIGDAAFNDLNKQNVTIGMDAVTHLVPKYETYGFRSVWNTIVVELDLEKVTANFAPISSPPGIAVTSLDAIDVAKVIEYDTSVFGTSRGQFLQAWITIPGSCGWGAMDETGNLVGFITVRRVISGADMKVGPLNQIGPFYADNDAVAKLLLKAAAESCRKVKGSDRFEYLCFDGGEYGHHGLQLVTGMEATPPIVIGPRMYTKGVPQGRLLHKIYGLTSPAFD